MNEHPFFTTILAKDFDQFVRPEPAGFGVADDFLQFLVQPLEGAGPVNLPGHQGEAEFEQEAGDVLEKLKLGKRKAIETKEKSGKQKVEIKARGQQSKN